MSTSCNSHSRGLQSCKKYRSQSFISSRFNGICCLDERLCSSVRTIFITGGAATRKSMEGLSAERRVNSTASTPRSAAVCQRCFGADYLGVRSCRLHLDGDVLLLLYVDWLYDGRVVTSVTRMTSAGPFDIGNTPARTTERSRSLSLATKKANNGGSEHLTTHYHRPAHDETIRHACTIRWCQLTAQRAMRKPCAAPTQAHDSA